MKQTSQSFLDNASEALKDPDKVERRDLMALFTPLIRNTAMDSFGQFESLRQQVKAVREHSLANLDHYLPRFEQETLRNGNHLHYARDGDELNSVVLDICQQHSARRIAGVAALLLKWNQAR